MKLVDKTAEKQQKKKVVGKPFKKGASGNPKGRPKGSISITAEIKKKLEEFYDKKTKQTYLAKFLEVLMAKAIEEEDWDVMKQIWAYIDGLPPQSVDMTSGGEKLDQLIMTIQPSQFYDSKNIDDKKNMHKM